MHTHIKFGSYVLIMPQKCTKDLMFGTICSPKIYIPAYNSLNSGDLIKNSQFR